MVPNYSTSCVSPTDPTCYGRIHVEFEGDWLAAGYCGSRVCDNNTLVQDTVAKSASTLIDVQGFVFWDPDHVNDTFHSFSGWELHPLTAWRMHQVAPPDFSIATSPTTMTISAGSSGTSTVALTGLNGFTGGLDLTATVESGGLISLSPSSASLNPTTVILSSGGTGTSTLTVSTSLLTTPGTYTVTVTATSGTLSHSARQSHCKTLLCETGSEGSGS